MASSARAMRSSVACLGGCEGRFAAAVGGLRGAAREAGREAVLVGFFDIFGVPDGAPITAPKQARKHLKSEKKERLGGVAIGTAAVIVPPNLPGPAGRPRVAGLFPFYGG